MVEIIPSSDTFDIDRFNLFCKKNDLNFPQDYINYIKEYNDGELEENLVDGFDDISIRYFYGTTGESYSDLEWNYECLLGRLPAKCVPIAEVEGGDLICMSLQPDSFGSVYYWDHDTMDVDEGDMCDYGVEELQAVASSFSELIEKINPV